MTENLDIFKFSRTLRWTSLQPDNCWFSKLKMIPVCRNIGKNKLMDHRSCPQCQTLKRKKASSLTCVSHFRPPHMFLGSSTTISTCTSTHTCTPSPPHPPPPCTTPRPSCPLRWELSTTARWGESWILLFIQTLTWFFCLDFHKSLNLLLTPCYSSTHTSTEERPGPRSPQSLCFTEPRRNPSEEQWVQHYSNTD